MDERRSVPAFALSGGGCGSSADQFLREVNEAFARLKADQSAFADYENEVSEWDCVADPISE